MDSELIVDEDEEPDPKLHEITNRILGAAFAVPSETSAAHPFNVKKLKEGIKRIAQ